MRGHTAIYGNVKIRRGYCGRCRVSAFILDGKLQCCYSAVDFKSDRAVRVCEPEQRRRYPSAAERRMILEQQRNECLYCERGFETRATWKGKEVELRICWDHIVPFSHSQNNGWANFGAACQICNSLKSAKMFDTLDEARIYLLNRRAEMGDSSVYGLRVENGG